MIMQDNNLVDELLKDANMTLLESREDTLDLSLEWNINKYESDKIREL